MHGWGSGRLLLPQPKVFTWRTSEGRTAKLPLFYDGNPGDINYESSEPPVQRYAKQKQPSSLVTDTLLNGADGGGIAVAYVYRGFSTRNVQFTSTILVLVLSRDL